MRYQRLMVVGLCLAAATSQGQGSFPVGGGGGGSTGTSGFMPNLPIYPGVWQHGYTCGIKNEGVQIIGDLATWEYFWSYRHNKVGALNPFPLPKDVDFNREIIVAANMGERTSGGYEVVIEKVQIEKGGLVVYLVFYEPSGPVTAQMTQPYDYRKIPANFKYYLFNGYRVRKVTR